MSMTITEIETVVRDYLAPVVKAMLAEDAPGASLEDAGLTVSDIAALVNPNEVYTANDVVHFLKVVPSVLKKFYESKLALMRRGIFPYFKKAQ